MSESKDPVEPITSDFSPWSMLDNRGGASLKVFLVTTAIVLGALAAFFGIVHYWR